MSKSSEISERRLSARKSGDADYQQRRTDIVRAAANVFRRKGFQAANLLDIAKEAGIDRASLYYYVSGKEEIFHEVVLDATQKNVAMVVEIQGSNQSAPQQISSLVERLIRSYEEHYPYLYVYVQENMAHIDESTPWSREMRALGKRFDDSVTAIIEKGIDAGTLKAAAGVDARLLAYALIGMCNWSHRWFTPGGRRTAQGISKAFSEVLLHGLARR